MRWLVEVASLSAGGGGPRRLSVEAPTWQAALAQARAAGGDTGPLSNFTIEVESNGYRATNALARVRYLVMRASEETPLAGSSSVRDEHSSPTSAPSLNTPPPSVPPSSAPPASVPPASRPSTPAAQAAAVLGSGRRPSVRTMALGSSGGAARDARASAPSATGAPAMPPSAPPSASPATLPERTPVTRAAPRAAPAIAGTAGTTGTTGTTGTDARGGVPNGELGTVFLERGEDPSARTPLTYREVAIALEGANPERAFRAAQAHLADVKRALDAAGAPSGRLVRLAVFDHSWTARPLRPALVTLTYKDWKGPEAQVSYPSMGGRQPPSAPGQANAPPQPSLSVSPASSQPRPSLRPDDLMSEIFESLHDLRFLRDTLEGAEFVLELLLEKVPTQVALVHLYDINTNEFVVVRARAPRLDVIGMRTEEGSGLIGAAAKTGRPILIEDTANDERWQRDRYRAAGHDPKRIIVVPIRHGQRYLGALEVADHADDAPFTDSEIHALTYIADQFAEFIAERGLILVRSDTGPFGTIDVTKRRR